MRAPAKEKNEGQAIRAMEYYAAECLLAPCAAANDYTSFGASFEDTH